MGFGIKQDYVENPGPVYFLDDVTSDRGIVFQPDVYSLARFLGDLSVEDGILNVLDVGCGWGDKLAVMHEQRPDWLFMGVDYGANINRCRSAFPWGHWIDADLESGVPRPEWAPHIVICSDVIEHLVEPRELLSSLRQPWASGALFVFSTPERDVQHGYDHMGPSPNLCHVREWNAAELHWLLEAHGFEIVHHGLTRGSDQGWAMATQVVVCR